MKLQWLNAATRLPLLFLMVATISCGCAQDRSLEQLGGGSIKIESDNPQFKLAISRHLEHRISPLVYMSWFPRPDSEEFAEINPAGSGFRGWVHDGAAGPMLGARATPTGLEEIHQLLNRLPPSGQNIPQHAAVILTYQNGTGYDTRIYDRFALPISVHRIWHLIASPGMAMDCEPPASTQTSGAEDQPMESPRP